MKALFLDRDGTLNIDAGSVTSSDDIVLLSHVIEGLTAFRDAGYRFFVFTNQGAVGEGRDTMENMQACNDRVQSLLADNGITIEKIFLCIHGRDEGCACRKPGRGMYDQYLQSFDAPDAQSIMVGDKDLDIAFGDAIGMKTARILSSMYERTIAATYPVRDLLELSQLVLSDTDQKIIDRSSLRSITSDIRAQGKTIVTTNGTFDLLHDGHRSLFEAARTYGDILVVGINSDASVRAYKGKDRPIQSQMLRATAVSRYADYVFVFDDPDPRGWLEDSNTNVHVNADTYGTDCVEAPLLQKMGATLALVPVHAKLGSTTEILRSLTKS